MKNLISVVGPTGIGKTRLAIDLAQHFKTEIVSCDSRQFFKEMKIGTAAPSEEELAAAPHHFIGNLSVEDYYSIGQYEEDALQKLNELFKNYDTVILVGGSMMYEKAVIEGLNDLPEANPENQEKLQIIMEEEGVEKLQQILQELDPEYFAVVDIHNHRRLLRAIDVIWQTNKKYSEQIAVSQDSRDFNVIRIGIEAPREELYDRINRRVDIMMENGLLDEVKSLEKFKGLTALNTVGYSELFKYLDGEWDLDFAVSEIKKNSRRYAKRQLTWYRKAADIHYLQLGYSPQDYKELLHWISEQFQY
ncbi:tRNA (adenosine(37)-N6)-dimethylallyltransferase MiaA [Chryseobacterium indologenes]|uniref:tRNA (adenosine(37)-N6)-dimethylallyltransferase MiaA n=1 Tax=Chryseobacterium indologenes TaxID=253 RepID=UPI000BFE21EC|nr:tRNA (adenosine(37)-N6)-dimethylallyltransferase MiaA [Chryseobacterium indologenes]ATN06469.1 tRNA (adenosine(37)-N6)-dimethylallyltransferase MiaA [Chryseobacterium indologenes]AYY84770.1 tRNA (adenosine(37)-N6)-dimethylallyltransferase MiaA [Chryseobacterium indologenes]QIX81656.1 tRNA (adenosine(37)-N6)-dimethylallyltransferase MiaA [Chryseobacterium indologenes]UDQ55420.1 tRNA (adenosine(37)-N6)-dimethylallyltransferase MiaA [Chryseobacterium indologenes]HAO29616.1 tRNA (adenosine(37)-